LDSTSHIHGFKKNQLAKACQIFNYENLEMSKSDFKSRGLQIIHPSTEEIKLYCNEFMGAVNKKNFGKINEMYSDESLVNLKDFWDKYHSCLPKYAKSYHRDIKAIVPNSFLKKYSNKLFN